VAEAVTALLADRADLVSGRVRTYGEIAKREGITKRYVGHLIPLAFLAPEIVQNILVGNQPIDLTAETLTKRTELPLIWTEQKIALGMGEAQWRVASKRLKARVQKVLRVCTPLSPPPSPSLR
jgi:hypothetical protein